MAWRTCTQDAIACLIWLSPLSLEKAFSTPTLKLTTAVPVVSDSRNPDSGNPPMGTVKVYRFVRN